MTFPSSRSSPRVLLACEFGAGRTHALNVAGVARRLAAEGIDCLTAFYDPGFAPMIAAAGSRVVQTYVWPSRRRAPTPWTPRPAVSLGDVLANMGVAHPPSLRACLAHYDGLFLLYEPDLVLAENAFGALLAALGRIRVIAFGTGASLPPSVAGGFPVRDRLDRERSWDEDEVRDGINAGLDGTGRPALSRLSDLFDIAGLYPFGPPELDVYRRQRHSPVLPPYLPDVPAPTDAPRAADEIFVYLHAFVQRSEPVMAALHGLPASARIYIPDLTAANRDALAREGKRIKDSPLAPEAMIRRSRCIVHHGGQQLTSLCLIHGIPQIVIAKEPENVEAARLVEHLGVGYGTMLSNLTPTWFAKALALVTTNPECEATCRRRRADFASWLDEDPTRTVAREALALLRGRES